MTWTVLLHDEFADELTAFDEKLQDELLAHAKLLAEFGPNLGRPSIWLGLPFTRKCPRHLKSSLGGRVLRTAIAVANSRAT
jgi:hypothetical protein